MCTIDVTSMNTFLKTSTGAFTWLPKCYRK